MASLSGKDPAPEITGVRGVVTKRGIGSRLRQPRRAVVYLAASLILVLGLYAVALYQLRPPSPGTQFSLGQLIKTAQCSTASSSSSSSACRAVDNRITDARFLDVDHRIVGTFVSKAGTNPRQFWSAYPRSD